MKYLLLSKSGVVLKAYDYEIEGRNVVSIDDKTYNAKLSNVPEHYGAIWNGSDIVYYFIEASKRDSIVEVRDSYITKIKPVMENVWYQEKLGLTNEELEDLKELYFRLLDAPQHFDVSDDKENWSFRWVEEYTSGKNTDNYQLKKLAFVKC